MTGWMTLIFSIILGYLFFLYLSHPQKKKHKVPKISLGKHLDILPNVRLHKGKKTYHFHHWLLFTLAIAIPVIIYEQFPYPMIVRGMLVGGILQGLRYSDRFKFRYPREWEQFGEQISKELNEFNEKIKKTQKPDVRASEIETD